jgi:hypothetical protein
VNTFHSIVLDASGSPDDSPAGYEVFTSGDGTNWGSAIATGVGNTGMTLISFTGKTGRYIKIVQTGAKGNYWSIHEFYVFGKVDVAGIEVTPASATIRVDSVKQLAAVILPVNATNKAVTWTSSDPAVATVTNDGLVEAQSPGIAVITVTTADGGKTAVSTDTVVAAPLPERNLLHPFLYAYHTFGEVVVTWTAPKLEGVKAYLVERSDDGRHFSGLERYQAGKGRLTYQVYDRTPGAGGNYYRLQVTGAHNEIAYSNIVKAAGVGESSLTVYPNPVTGSELRLQFRGVAAGKYQLRLLNYLNQQVYSATVNVPGPDAVLPMHWSSNLLPGYYLLEAVHGNGQRFVRPVVIQ